MNRPREGLKTYVILDASGKKISEGGGESAHVALGVSKLFYPEAKTAILKSEYVRMEKETKWLRAAARVEA